MNTLRYLNTMLTVLAVLLALNLWTAWSAGPSVSPEAHAQGIPDSGAQRAQIVDQLKKLNERSAEIKTLLESGEIRVRVVEPDED